MSFMARYRLQYRVTIIPHFEPPLEDTGGAGSPVVDARQVTAALLFAGSQFAGSHRFRKSKDNDYEMLVEDAYDVIRC